MNSTANASDAVPNDGVCETALGNGVCTLRAALQESNAHVGLDTVTFSIGSGWQTIFIDDQALPPIVDPAVIDGTTQPGYAGTPLIELRQGNALDISALVITGGNSTVRGLSITSLFLDGIVISGLGGNKIEGNWLGIRPDGSYQFTFLASIHVYTPNNTIGGTEPGAGNDIVPNWYGVFLEGAAATGNQVQGNSIVGGAVNAIEVTGGGNLIGGTSAGARNVIEGSVQLSSDGNTVQGNYIGVDATGVAASRDWFMPLTITGADNLIGGSMVGARNVLVEMVLGRAATGNVIQGNYIGLGADGVTPIEYHPEGCCPDRDLIQINGGGGNIIGGVGPGESNVIAHAGVDGVNVREVEDSPGDGNTIRGNSIHSNAGLGIDNENGGNNDLAPPVITSAAVAGTACANCTVDVYSDNEDEGAIYHGFTVADENGNWVYSGAVTGPNLTATATDTDGNTSEFSAPFPVSTVTDSDGDGCSDEQEMGPEPTLGGDRDPNNFWDFFDVTGDKFIDLSDTLDVLDYFGDDGTLPAANLRDRYMPDSERRWRTAESNDGIDLTDALANLQSFGHGC